MGELYAWPPQGPGEREPSTLGDQALIGSMHRGTAQQLVRVGGGGDHHLFVPSEVAEKIRDIPACGTPVIFDGIQGTT